ncbi:GSCOCG00009510001-RA-CDS [Cotesia congregata]|uniref:Replication protein A subunit n=1 Tax=Cotesia congregata TaxID=51543 RepID=A0A8J2E551_COTCN|nr:GSCOCG00009510001-RA-CDS [Cotesia congregata]CAG5073694.1 Similar to rpa1: Replication protein A 70 kDa DNA-binding subunit (Danio rerio) [Cotesia congregata]
MIPLTQGALNEIAQGIEVDKPVFQILGTKRLASTESERYRLLLSDGVTSNSFTMLATQLNGMVTNNELSDFSIIEITRYALTNANNAGKMRKIMVILGIEVKVPGHQVPGKIGNPTQQGKDGAASGDMRPTQPVTGSPNESFDQTQNKRPAANAVQPNANAAQKRRLNESLNAGTSIMTSPIAALSPYQNKWVIKARVANKSDIRTWSNSRGEGKLFNMTLVDESGEIRCTGFTDSVDKFYNIIETGKIYYISRGTLKVANKNYNTTNNDYEMTLNNDSEIVPCHESCEEIPMMNFNFVSIDEIERLNKDAIIDVIAVVKSTVDVQTLTAKQTGRELKKRDVFLVDTSNTCVTLTLWGTQAENFDGSNNPVIALKGVRIGEYQNGKTLSTISSTAMQIDPDIPEAHRLRSWFINEGQTTEVKSISKAASGPSQWLSIQDAEQEAQSAGTKPVNFTCKAAISIIRAERALYKACPTDGCNKKIVEVGSTMFRCEKCNKDFPNFRWRLIASMAITDWSGNMWVTVFNESAEKILGTSAEEIGELCVNQSEAYNDKFAEITFDSYIFEIKMKMETYNDEQRMKSSVVAIQPIDYLTYNKRLISEIKKCANIHDVNAK